MKLYLSSYRFGDNPQQLADLILANKRMAIIPNALDVYPDGERKNVGLQREIDGLKQIGLETKLVDLKIYFGKPDELVQKMNEFGGVWVIGGNTFVLRRAFLESGMDNWIVSKKGDKDFVYAGYSAGVCVLSPTLKGLETVDEPNNVPENYKPGVIWGGLNIIDFAFAPHYRSDHPESAAVEKEVEYYINNKIKYKTLHDGEVIITDTDSLVE